MTIPEITGGRVGVGWLDIRCPSCDQVNRIGVKCPIEGHRCKECDAMIDFWAAWSDEDHREYDRELRREYWADQGPFF